LLAWLVQGVMVYLCLEATHLDLDFPHALFVLAAINVAVLIPGAPSGIGPFEFAAIVSLGAFGVSKTPGLSFGLLYHFIQIVPTIAVGLIALSVLGMHFSDLGSRRDGEPTAS
jgi:glycosyltransferase 2 family protein